MCHSTWWSKNARLLGKRNISFADKLHVVESIPGVMNNIHGEDYDKALIVLKKALDALAHALFVEYSWEHGQDETDEWTNSEAKKLSDACHRTKQYLDELSQEELETDGN